MASTTSKSFTFWSHLVLGPPATGLMHSQTSRGLAGTIPSPRYLRRDDTTRSPAARPRRAPHPSATAGGGRPAPRRPGRGTRAAGRTHALPANSAEGLHETDTSLCGERTPSAATAPPLPRPPPSAAPGPRPLTVRRQPRQPPGSRR